MNWAWLTGIAALAWLALLLLAGRVWRVREWLDAPAGAAAPDLSEVTAIVPARNEAATIAECLVALAGQGAGLRVVVVDDQSEDETRAIASRLPIRGLRVVPGRPVPAGWVGKVWALEQGRAHADTRYTLLLDADIGLCPGILGALLHKMQREQLHLVSLMARLPMERFFDRLLLPAFVYFFKLLYPFALSNSPRWPQVAAAAGGCILLETRVLDAIGGFAALRAELIDDCALAKLAKARAFRTWLGLTRSAAVLRPHYGLAAIGNMVARTAFTQLRGSAARLLLLSGLFMALFFLPPIALLAGDAAARGLAAAGLAAMAASYVPVLAFYRVPVAWALALPASAGLLLAMTWVSAARHWRGRGARWKGRHYPAAS